MTLTLLALALGAVVGLVLPPRARPVAGPAASGTVASGLRHLPVLAVGAVLQLLAGRLDGTGATVVVLVAFVAIVGWSVANRHLRGLLLVAAGTAANALVIAVNGAMPVRPRTLVDAGILTAAELPTAELVGFRRIEPDGVLGFLGDTLALRPLGAVLSIGDVIVAVGCAAAVAQLVRRRFATDPSPTVAPGGLD